MCTIMPPRGGLGEGSPIENKMFWGCFLWLLDDGTPKLAKIIKLNSALGWGGGGGGGGGTEERIICNVLWVAINPVAI